MDILSPRRQGPRQRTLFDCDRSSVHCAPQRAVIVLGKSVGHALNGIATQRGDLVLLIRRPNRPTAELSDACSNILLFALRQLPQEYLVPVRFLETQPIVNSGQKTSFTHHPISSLVEKVLRPSVSRSVVRIPAVLDHSASDLVEYHYHILTLVIPTVLRTTVHVVLGYILVHEWSNQPFYRNAIRHWRAPTGRPRYDPSAHTLRPSVCPACSPAGIFASLHDDGRQAAH